MTRTKTPPPTLAARLADQQRSGLWLYRQLRAAGIKASRSKVYGWIAGDESYREPTLKERAAIERALKNGR